MSRRWLPADTRQSRWNAQQSRTRREAVEAAELRIAIARPLSMRLDATRVISDDAVTGLGKLALLPNEVIMLVFANSTLHSLLRLLRVNRAARQFVRLLPSFADVTSSVKLQMSRAKPPYRRLLATVLKNTTYNALRFLITTHDSEELLASSSIVTEPDGDDELKIHKTSRSHSLDANTHRLRVDGFVRNRLELSIAQLQSEFEQHEVVCALQCAGNRRRDLRTAVKEVQGIDWFDGAVMDCRWRGPLLKDVLAKAGIDLDGAEADGQAKQAAEAHVAFASFQVQCQEDTWYGASIPLGCAVDREKEVILALGRNGKPLSTRHGYPITVQKSECSNYYMQHGYKALPREAVDSESAEKYWHITPPVQEMTVNSVVTSPRTGETVSRNERGNVECHGYALLCGDGGPIVKVEVSGDHGRMWIPANWNTMKARASGRGSSGKLNSL
ncbi:Uu.00g062930.m01.CDS01 [Anthostomella pinea]|uniref:Uu.00g062930.m01.CDS01 n=1 Tax=Anthostomella pinea TaxID=933095 RepID=A0AAI8YMX6_9PEZI|nr:Uu.00g062930.m01.CDS01 [Anthostomella pinea]